MGPSAGAPTFLVCMGVGPALGPDSLTCLQEGQKLINPGAGGWVDSQLATLFVGPLPSQSFPGAS